jgi:hypothetical protein
MISIFSIYLNTLINTAAIVAIAEVIPTTPATPSFSLGALFGTKISAPGFTFG